MQPGKKKLKTYGNQLIALTGGIGSGKSFVLRCFAKLGFVTIDTDGLVHKLLLPNTEVHHKIAKLFPQCVQEDGTINRNVLFALASNSESGIKQLEEIIHPALWHYRSEYILALRKRSRRSIVVEIPLFFERTQHNDPLHYDIAISTICAPEVQKSRAIRRNHMTIEKFNAIMAKQVNNEVRRQNADILVDTTYNKAHVFRQIKNVIANGRKRAKNSIGH
ncbi:MAG: dephospho-CoA kinase [Proteobacteria bacterium]|nr:dephospho-CoA kinase [Pseudomonadota bacterium]